MHHLTFDAQFSNQPSQNQELTGRVICYTQTRALYDSALNNEKHRGMASIMSLCLAESCGRRPAGRSIRRPLPGAVKVADSLGITYISFYILYQHEFKTIDHAWQSVRRVLQGRPGPGIWKQCTAERQEISMQQQQNQAEMLRLHVPRLPG